MLCASGGEQRAGCGHQCVSVASLQWRGASQVDWERSAATPLATPQLTAPRSLHDSREVGRPDPVTLNAMDRQ